MKQAIEVVREHLSKLAVEGSPDAIALTLEAQNIKAFCGQGDQCAIAVSVMKALYEKLGTTHGLRVAVRSGGRVDLYEEGVCSAAVRIHPESETLGEFIMRFDQRRYPALIAS